MQARYGSSVGTAVTHVPFYHIAEDPEDALLSPLYYTSCSLAWLLFYSSPKAPCHHKGSSLFSSQSSFLWAEPSKIESDADEERPKKSQSSDFSSYAI